MASPPPSLHLINAFLREIQQKGEIPDVAALQAPSLDPAHHCSLRDFLTSVNKHGDTPFLVAARHGHVTLLEELHKEYGISLGRRNHDGKTGLHEAAQNGKEECVHYLVGAGLDIDSLKKADWWVWHISQFLYLRVIITTLISHTPPQSPPPLSLQDPPHACLY